MIYLVDVNVLCEPTKRCPHESVQRWLDRHEAEIAVDPIIMGEIWHGILRLPAGNRKERLRVWFQALQSHMPCLEWTLDMAVIWAEICDHVQSSGFTLTVPDTMIAATAKRHGLIVATRNVSDFTRCGVPVVNPFEA
ncbi:MAG TPA: type II toxin-antitoxin system VapC family toxin [Bacteroidia bacterium]|nr:type II toxin-antitoxin system VapC family toxin [Bacteroidia bacterium]